MTSRPDISFDTQGRVSMHIEQNGIAMVLRFSPDVADEIGKRFRDMAFHARSVAESLKNVTRHLEYKSEPVKESSFEVNEDTPYQAMRSRQAEEAAGKQAKDLSTGLGGVSEGSE
jgi:hypothetical protein